MTSEHVRVCTASDLGGLDSLAAPERTLQDPDSTSQVLLSSSRPYRQADPPEHQ